MVPKEPQSKVPYFDPQIPLLRVGVEGRKFLCVARTSDPCRLTLLGQLPELVAFVQYSTRVEHQPRHKPMFNAALNYYYYSCRFQCCRSRNLPLPAMEPTRPTHKGGVTVLRQLEAARVYVPPCLLSEFASQYSDPFLCAGNRNRKTGNRNTGNSAGSSALLHRKRKWWRPCTWKCLIWRQNRNRIWNRGRSSPIEPETEMVAPLDQLYHVTGNRIEGALLPNIRSWVDLYCSWSFDIFVTA